MSPAFGRGDYLATYEVDLLRLYDAATLRLVATIPTGHTVPTGIVVEDDGQVVVRGAGLSVYSMDGTPIRTLSAEAGRGWLARLKPGWVAATFFDDVVAYSVDGKSVQRVDSFFVPLGLNVTPGGKLLVRSQHQVRIYSGWPLRLQSSITFGDDVTSVEPISADVIVVATSPHGDQMEEPRKPVGEVTLYEYKLSDQGLLHKVSLGLKGFSIVSRVGDMIAVYVDQCSTLRPGTVVFLRSDLSRSDLKDYDVGGTASVTATDHELIMGVSPCTSRVPGEIWEYDVLTGIPKKLFDGPFLALGSRE